MRHLFIINPVAGRKGSTQALLDQLDRVSFPHERVFTEGEGHAEKLARQAAQTGEPVRIWACGGDGTLNEVVNGAAGFLQRQEMPDGTMKIVILPLPLIHMEGGKTIFKGEKKTQAESGF